MEVTVRFEAYDYNEREESFTDEIAFREFVQRIEEHDVFRLLSIEVGGESFNLPQY